MSAGKISLSVLALTLALAAAPHAAVADPGNNHWNNGRNNNGQNNNGWDNNRGNDWHDRDDNRGPRHIYARPVIVQQPVYRNRVVYRDPPYYYHSAPIRVMEVPPYMLARLRPAPRGYFYCMGDRDVYMVSAADNIIVQAIALATLMN